MNIKALITTLLVLGSSSMALAARPAVPGTAGAPVVRDHRAPTPAPAPAPAYGGSHHNRRFAPMWVTLGAESRMMNGEVAFRVSPSLGRFTTLKLQSSSGKSFIHQVKIRFASGRTQVVALDRYLTAGSPAITIDLAGDHARAIRSVTVVGRNARYSAFKVLAI
jgi:hypothetical protein